MIRVEDRQSLLVWTLEDARRGNPLGPEMVAELEAQLERLAGDLASHPALRILLIRAQPSSSGVWMSGGDLKAFAQMGREAAHGFCLQVARLGQSLSALPLLVVVEVDGLVVGGANEWIQYADFRTASARSEFFFKHLQVGLPCGFGGATLLRRVLGASRLKQLLFLSQKISATKALDFGLIDVVEECGDGFISKLQKNLLDVPRELLAAIKQQVASELSGVDEIEIFAKVWQNSKHHQFLKDWL